MTTPGTDATQYATQYATHTRDRFRDLHPAIADAHRWLRKHTPRTAERIIAQHNGMTPEHWRGVIANIQLEVGHNAARAQRRTERLSAASQPQTADTPTPTAGQLPGAASAAGRSPRRVPSESMPDAASILLDDPKSSTPSKIGVSCDSDDKTTDDIATRVERYAKHRDQAERQAAYLADVDPTSEIACGHRVDDIASDLRLCGSFLVFHRYDCIGENRLAAARFCQRGRLCAFCSMRRMVRKVARVVPIVWQAIQDTGTLPYLETLTVKNGPDLAERLGHIRDADRSLNDQARKYRHWVRTGKGRERRYTERAKAVGQCWSIEIKRGEGSAKWHPHMHSLVLCETPIDETALSAEWKELTGDSHVVDVRPFYCVEKIKAGATLDEVRDDLARDLIEVLSYTLKFSTMTPADTWEGYKVCHGMHLSRCRGVLYGCDVKDEYLDAPLAYDDLPYVEVVARWADGAYILDAADAWHDPATDLHAEYRNEVLA